MVSKVPSEITAFTGGIFLDIVIGEKIGLGVGIIASISVGRGVTVGEKVGIDELVGCEKGTVLANVGLLVVADEAEPRMSGILLFIIIITRALDTAVRPTSTTSPISQAGIWCPDCVTGFTRDEASCRFLPSLCLDKRRSRAAENSDMERKRSSGFLVSALIRIFSMDSGRP